MDKIDSAIILVGQKNLSNIQINEESLKNNILQLLDVGFENIILSTNSFLNEYEKFCKKNHFNPNIVRVIKERETLGSGGAIKNVMLSLNYETSLILYADSSLNFDLKKILELHSNGKEKNSLLTFDSQESITLKKENIKGKLDIFLVNIELFNHTHLNKFSFIKDLLPLTFKDEFNCLNL